MKIKQIFSKSISNLLYTGSIIGASTFILTLITLLYWRRDGFDAIEISLMSIIAGLYLFITIIPTNIVLLNKSNKDFFKEDKKPMRRVYQILLVLIIGFVTFLAIDFIFYFIDDSIPKEFANNLKELAKNNGVPMDGIDEFAKLTFGLQNGIVTFIIGLVATFISVPFIKKDGSLFESKNEWR